MAQLVARLVRNEKVGGSSPPSSTDSKALTGQPTGQSLCCVAPGGGDQTPAARFTSSAIFFSSAGEISVTANAVAHMVPSSSRAGSKKAKLP